MLFTRQYRPPLRATRLILVILLLVISFSIHAQEIFLPSEIRLQNDRLALQNGDDLTYTVPYYPASELRREIKQRQTQLQKHKKALNRTVKKNRFNSTNAFIIAFVPGGLLYAALKKNRAMAAEKTLLKVNHELTSLKEAQQNLLALQQDTRW